MTKKNRKTTLASIVTAVYILATMTACSNGVNSNNLSSDTVTTTYTELQTPISETTTSPAPVETEQKDEATEKEQTESSVTSDTSAPETEQSVPETEQTTTSQTEAETPAPETTTTVQTTPQTEAQVTTPATTVTTSPAPEWDESMVSGTKYVNTACYSRKKAVLGAETVKLYNVNDKVTVVAKTNTDYYKLDDGTFIHSDYLSDSKVAVTTTTTVQTTTPKPQDTTPAETEKPQEETPKQEIVTLYSQYSKTLDGQSNKFYSDVECTKYAGGTDWRNFVIEAIKINDDVYQIVADTPETAHRNGKYVKASDFSPVKAYMNPIYENYDIEGMKQRLIEIGTKEYGLVYKPAFERLDGTTWGFPDTINITMLPGKLEADIETLMAVKTESRHLDPGDTFAIYIEKDEYSSKYGMTEEEFNAKQYYTIYVIDGGRSIAEQ